MESIDSVFLHSPQFQSSSLSELLGMKLLLKLETLNPLRCFKGRGADLFVSELPTRNWTLVCASAGNFGQALAYCGRKRGLSVVVFAAATASTLKVERMRQLGAEVRLAGSDFDDAKEEAKRFSQASNSLYVEDGFEPSISEGAGTIAVELCASKNTIDYVLIPLGGGALLAGMAHWIKAKLPQTKVIGIGAVGAPIMVLSLRDRRTHVQQPVDTIADGIAIRVPVPEVLRDLENVVDDLLLVEDAQLIQAMRLLFQHHGIVSEPAGVAGLAAAIAYKDRFAGSTVATPICGGNLSDEQALRWLISPGENS